MSEPHSRKSEFHDIELIYLGWVEPNNGRMLNAVDLKINGELVTYKYFSWDWNYTALCSRYHPDSPNGQFFFLPSEGGGALIDTSNNYSAIGLHCTSKYASTMIGNTYFNDRIFVVHQDEVTVMHLPTLQQKIYEFKEIAVSWVSPIDDKQFELSYYDGISDEKQTQVVRFD